MNVNTDKALKKISTLIENLQKSEEFEEIHEEILNLCKIVYSRKSDYKDIDMPYPVEIKIKLRHFSASDEEEYEDIDGNPNRKIMLRKLKEDALSILQKLNRYFRLRKELED